MIRLTCSEVLKLPRNIFKGKIICFPTDTVYGVGTLFDDEVTVKRISTIKNRDVNKPLAVLAPSIDAITPYIEWPSKLVWEIMREHWPGALTIIFIKKNGYDYITNGLNTIAFRIPNSKVALKILNHLGPLATTSVNLSGEEPINDINVIEEEFFDQIDYLITDRELPSKLSSTIIDVTTANIKVIRLGDVKINV